MNANKYHSLKIITLLIECEHVPHDNGLIHLFDYQAARLPVVLIQNIIIFIELINK